MKEPIVEHLIDIHWDAREAVRTLHALVNARLAVPVDAGPEPIQADFDPVPYVPPPVTVTVPHPFSPTKMYQETIAYSPNQLAPNMMPDAASYAIARERFAAASRKHSDRAETIKATRAHLDELIKLKSKECKAELNAWLTLWKAPRAGESGRSVSDRIGAFTAVSDALYEARLAEQCIQTSQRVQGGIELIGPRTPDVTWLENFESQVDAAYAIGFESVADEQSQAGGPAELVRDAVKLSQFAQEYANRAGTSVKRLRSYTFDTELPKAPLAIAFAANMVALVLFAVLGLGAFVFYLIGQMLDLVSGFPIAWPLLFVPAAVAFLVCGALKELLDRRRTVLSSTMNNELRTSHSKLVESWRTFASGCNTAPARPFGDAHPDKILSV